MSTPRGPSVRAVLRSGSAAVAAGLAVNGVATYAFLVISARALGPASYSALSVLWFAAFAFGSGFFLPVEQEIARRVASATGHPSVTARQILRSAAPVSGAIVGALLLLVAAGGARILDAGFDGDWGLLIALGAVIPCLAASHIARGVAAGIGAFGPYGWALVVEGGFRLIGAAVLLAVSSSSATAFAAMVVAAPVLSAVPLVWAVGRGPTGAAVESDEPGNPAPDPMWAPVAKLVGAAALSQLVLNGPPVAVRLLAGQDGAEEAGRFVAVFVLARTPVFLFQAVQVTLLPRLARLAARAEVALLRRHLTRTVGALAGTGVAAAVVARLVGEPVVRALFGSEFDADATTMALIVLGAGAFVVAVTISQALVALQAHGVATLAWVPAIAIGVAAGGLWTSDPVDRVVAGFLVAGITAVTVTSVFVRLRLTSVPTSNVPPTRGPEGADEPAEPHAHVRDV